MISAALNFRCGHCTIHKKATMYHVPSLLVVFKYPDPDPADFCNLYKCSCNEIELLLAAAFVYEATALKLREAETVTLSCPCL